LEVLEQPPLFRNSLEPNRGFVLSFVISIPAGLLAYIISTYGMKPYLGSSFGSVVLSDFVGETFKAFCMLFVAIFLWLVVPNRRYGAALGALVGLGFGLGYQGLSCAIGQPDAGQAVMVMVFLTLMDVISATLTGLGLFALISNQQRLNSFLRALIGLPLFFYFLAVVSWLVWNAFAFAVRPNMAAEWILDIIIVIPLFAFIIRDFLGGHFNFQNFLQPLPEPDVFVPEPLPPPPSAP
jgi:ABC-type sugar transport system permease subunit